MKDEDYEELLEHEFRKWTDGPKYLIAENECLLECVRKRAIFIGTNEELVIWVKGFNGNIGTIYMDAEKSIIDCARAHRPLLDIRSLPHP